LISQTSRPHRLVLFYESEQQASSDARHELNIARRKVEDDLGSVAAMDVSYCKAVCVAYVITHCPTCILFDEENNVLTRIEDDSKFTRLWFLEELKEILKNRRLQCVV
jgi:hypothetical protein